MADRYDTVRRPESEFLALGALVDNPCGWKLEEQSLLDIGCGTGTFLNRMRRFVGKVSGLELNEGMLARAKALL